jgi:hypothetical protein
MSASLSAGRASVSSPRRCCSVLPQQHAPSGPRVPSRRRGGRWCAPGHHRQFFRHRRRRAEDRHWSFCDVLLMQLGRSADQRERVELPPPLSELRRTSRRTSRSSGRRLLPDANQLSKTPSAMMKWTPRARDASDVTNREAAICWDGAAEPYLSSGAAWRKSDAFCFGLEPSNHPVWLCERGYGASRTPAARHCSSQSGHDRL